MGKIVNKRELAEIVGKSQQTLTTWQKNGLPIESDGTSGRENLYDTEAVINWLIQREINTRIEQHGGDETEFYDYEMERARLTHHQANKAALDEHILRGDLRRTDEVEQEWTELVMNCRAKLLSVPTKSAHQLMGVTDLAEAQQILEELVHEALNELMDESEEESSETVRATTEVNGKRMGRSLQKTIQ